MGLALELAHRGRFLVSPNPKVGCVIVKPKSDDTGKARILGQGFHERVGELHAERNALASCTEDPRGATLYVNLEPCCHTGRTPPCVDAILQAGIQRVVIANRDPFPEVAGKGIERLRAQGIAVDVGVLEDEGFAENRFFFTRHIRQRPWVILKTATSLDGKCATATGNSQWITGEKARAHVHEARAEVDAILAGVGTVLSDNPHLTARPQSLSADAYRQPIRVVLDPNAQTPPDAALFGAIVSSPVLILHGPHAKPAALDALRASGAETVEVPLDDTRLSLPECLSLLAKREILSVWIEGGPTLHGVFLQSGLVDEVMIYMAPKIIGGTNAPTFSMPVGVEALSDCLTLTRLQRRFLGDDTLIQGWVASR